MSWQPARRSRAQNAFAANPVSQDVRAIRSKMLAEADQKRELAAAEERVHLAQAALDRASTLSAEKAALDAAMMHLEGLRGESFTGTGKAAAAPKRKL